MEYQTSVEHINKVCDYLQTKGNILKRSGPYVRESDEETDEDETTYNTEFDPEKVAALKELFREQANQLTSPQYILTMIHRGRFFSCPPLDVTNALNAVTILADKEHNKKEVKEKALSRGLNALGTAVVEILTYKLE